MNGYAHQAAPQQTNHTRLEPFHVHDLPQIYTRPTHSTLLHTLSLLASTPPTLSLSTLRSLRNGFTPKVHPEGVTSYLTSIISSSLAWLQSDGEREEVWDLASKRLTERAGRTATGDLTRKFRVPLPDPVADEVGEVELTLHEPSLTEDNLGLKTWGSSVVLASKLSGLTQHLPVLQRTSFVDQNDSSIKILELGSGTGLLGLAAACVWPQTTVNLTDLDTIVGNLRKNVFSNTDILRSARDVEAESDRIGVQVDVLDWSVSPSFREKSRYRSQGGDFEGRFDIILASDPLYSPQHPEWLVNTIGANISLDHHARVLVAYPLREGYEKERATLERLIDELGMSCIASGMDGVTEDWGGHDHEGEDDQDGEDDHRRHQSVKWGVWAWKTNRDGPER